MRALGFALILCGGFAAAGSAQTAPAEAPTAEPPPTPDPGTTAQLACISEDDGYEKEGKTFTFVIRLENKCLKPMRCEVFAYVIQAKGPSQGHAVMILGAKSQGAAAKKSHPIKVKMAGGMSQVARECRVIGAS
jgi:hypothetical protein